MKHGNAFKDISGFKFGRLTIVDFSHMEGKVSYWNVVCICGEKRTLRKGSLIGGHAQSCGCFKREILRTRLVTHGKAQSNLYSKWMGIVKRVYNTKTKDYKNYGGRGITCSWNTFEEFCTDMEDSYNTHLAEHGRENTSIDRIDVNGPYSKENCRWATKSEQARNRRNSNKISFMGKEQCLRSWADEYKIGRATLWARIYKWNWPIERALNIS